ncbi:MAG: BON domain-containing protein [Burkholderiales bacterium]|nr:BON domain-containing protein [Burkholderiales bacterium]
MRLCFKLCGLILYVGIALIQLGCSVPAFANLNYPYTGRAENQMRDDSELSVKIETEIKERYLKSSVAIKVVADHYNVLLLGQVDSQDTKNSLSQLIKNEPSVKQYWDYTTISTAPMLHENAAVNKKALLRIKDEDNITLDSLQTATVDNVVYILGNIQAEEIDNMDSAITGINAIAGVVKVVNLTQVATYATPSI